MKILTGKVVSKKMNKTAVVAVTRILEHPVYKKRLKRIKKYHVHDEMGSVVGDRVKFVDSKPVSKTKKWTISKILKAK
jgi:small subunit ribosomal protein S17